MALSFKEKRTLQKTVAAKMEELKGGSLSFKEKRAAQKELKDAFEKLQVKVEGNVENAKLKELVDGKYNNLKPLEFIGVLKEIVDEIKDIEPVKDPTIAYVEANQDKMIKEDQAVMEAALKDLVDAHAS